MLLKFSIKIFKVSFILKIRFHFLSEVRLVGKDVIVKKVTQVFCFSSEIRLARKNVTFEEATQVVVDKFMKTFLNSFKNKLIKKSQKIFKIYLLITYQIFLNDYSTSDFFLLTCFTNIYY